MTYGVVFTGKTALSKHTFKDYSNPLARITNICSLWLLDFQALTVFTDLLSEIQIGYVFVNGFFKGCHLQQTVSKQTFLIWYDISLKDTNMNLLFKDSFVHVQLILVVSFL